MKTNIIIHFIAAIFYTICGIWSLIKFLIYLVKDEPFGSLLPVWIFGAGFLILIINMFSVFFLNTKK